MKVKMEIVNVKDLKPDPNQPRKKFDQDAINNLAKTIHGHKIINPIEIDENNMIITGEIRWRALLKAGATKVLTKRITEIDDTTRFERQTIENFHHNLLSGIEKENAVKKLWESGDYETREALGDKLGIGQPLISRYLRAYKIRKETNSSNDISSLDLEHIGRIKNREERKILVEKMERKEIRPTEIREVIKTIKTVPKDIKEEILKPKSEITLEEAKEIAEFPKPEQRKIVIDQIKRTKQATKKIIEEEKEVALEKKPIPIIARIDIDKKKVNKMQDIFFQITQEYRDEELKEFSGKTQEKCIIIMRKAYQFIFKEVEKYGKRFME